MSADRASSPTLRVRIALALLYRYIGWSGATGLLMMGISAGLVADGLHRPISVPSRITAAPAASSSMAGEPVEFKTAVSSSDMFAAVLPRRSEITTVLHQMERAAVESGLAWPQAEYRVTPATDKDLQRLEVRCSVKGPYPSVRRMLVELLKTLPGFSVRELAMTRPTADAADIEAKMTLAVFLLDGPQRPNAAGSGP